MSLELEEYTLPMLPAHDSTHQNGSADEVVMLKRELFDRTGVTTFPLLFFGETFFGVMADVVDLYIEGATSVLLPRLKQPLSKGPLKHVAEVPLPNLVAAWLQLQQLRSEKIQFQMLQLQNLANLWRTPALRELRELTGAAFFVDKTGVQDSFARLEKALNETFVDDVSMAVEDGLPPSCNQF